MGSDDPDEIADLVNRAAAGEREAWAALVAQFNGLVWTVIRQHRLGREDAQDTSQVVWLRLLESLGRIREPNRLNAWLVTVTKRECLRQIRLRRPTVPLDDAPLPADQSRPVEDVVVARHRQREVFAVMRKLGQRCRQLLALCGHKLPYQDIADVMDMPRGSIGPTRMRCLRELRQLLREAGIDPDTPDS